MRRFASGDAGILPPDPLYCFRENMGYVHTICFPKRNPNFSDLLLAGTEKGDVYFLDLECNRVQHKQNMGESIQAIHSKVYDIITHEKSGLVKLWAIENNTGYKVQRTFNCYGGFCKSVLIDEQLVLPQDQGSVEAIDLDTFKTVRKYVPDKNENLGSVMCLEKFDIGGVAYLLVGYESGNLILFDFSTGRPVCQLTLKEFITSVTFDPVSCRGVVSNSSNTLQVFRIDPECLEMTLQAELALPNDGCQIVKFRPDHRLLMAGGWDGRLRWSRWIYCPLERLPLVHLLNSFTLSF
ncbi:guanine nucleotide-binding protein subunit beta-like protein 1 isoform X2 [Anthonomus grandis grandis]|uniref:guanine nucleotide-binding protein subunit beta-like protein 1 isoform X2 n=1 Tax=Anthonomus grandis grandis TaxID=2921223 RepID=UPI0021657669|nr:guanine nucleotide-binding protein subunit beta-like protein 1 isoform X2 [Anthonomus grandis grandis]